MRKALGIGIGTTTLTVLLVVALALLVSHAGRGAPLQARDAVSQGPVTIDAVAGETFTPTTSLTATTALSAGAVVPQVAYEKDLGIQKVGLPPGASFQAGYLTMPYTGKEQLVYAMTWHLCAPAVVVPGTQTPQNDTSACEAWAFVNPNTGEMVDMTFTK